MFISDIYAYQECIGKQLSKGDLDQSLQIQQPESRRKALQEACESMLFKASLLVKNPYITSKFFKQITDL